MCIIVAIENLSYSGTEYSVRFISVTHSGEGQFYKDYG